MKARAVWLLIILSLALLVAYLMMGPVRVFFLTPLFYTIRFIQVIYNALPQVVCWGSLILGLGVLGLQVLLGKRAPSRETSLRFEEQRLSRVQTWSRWVEGAKRGDYSRWMLARHAAGLVVELLAHQERLSSDQARQVLRDGKLAIPSDIRDYVLLGLDTPSFRHYSDLLSLYRSSQLATPLELDPEIIIRYLESGIESRGAL